MPVLPTQKRVRAKLTTEQKAHRRQKLTNLTDAINTARDVYQEEARTISQDHGRCVYIFNKMKEKLMYPSSLTGL